MVSRAPSAGGGLRRAVPATGALRRAVLLGALLPVVLGCQLGAGDIAAPAPSAGIAPAAPRAVGARAAVVVASPALGRGSSGRRGADDDEAPAPPAPPPGDVDL